MVVHENPASLSHSAVTCTSVPLFSIFAELAHLVENPLDGGTATFSIASRVLLIYLVTLRPSLSLRNFKSNPNSVSVVNSGLISGFPS